MAVDCTMLVTLISIASTQSKATKNTFNKVTWLLNHAPSNPDAKIMSTASDMVLHLHLHSDSSCLSEPKARSHAGGHFFLSDLSRSPNKQPKTTPTPNGPISSLLCIIRNVMGSAAEAEIASSCMNGQEAIPIRTTLNEMGHPQPPTPVQVDNSTAEGFANGTIKQKRSKAIDARFCWIQDRTRQGQFLICWRPGTDNLGDCHTKHHSAAHHRQVRPNYLHPSEQWTEQQFANNVIHLLLRSCVTSRGTHGTHESEEAQNPFTTLANRRRATRAPYASLSVQQQQQTTTTNDHRPINLVTTSLPSYIVKTTAIMTTTSTNDKPYQILDQPIYHLCEKPLWDEGKDVYYPPTFEQDCKITHAGMHVEKLLGSANHFYKSSKAEWLCLEINPNILLENGIKTMVESPANVGATSAERVTIRFPHIYGGISKTTPNLVAKVCPMIRSPDGTFSEIPNRA